MELLTSIEGRTTYLDTNIFIYFLQDYACFRRDLSGLFSEIEAGRLHALTSALTVAEVLVIPFRANDTAAQQAYREALTPHAGLNVVPISDGVLIEAARLRAEHPELRLPDAIHVATARLSGCQAFLTNDRRLSHSEAPNVIVLSDFAETPNKG